MFSIKELEVKKTKLKQLVDEKGQELDQAHKLIQAIVEQGCLLRGKYDQIDSMIKELHERETVAATEGTGDKIEVVGTV